jgi:hypothetical protein
VSYTPELKQVIRRVEETRHIRLKKKRSGWEFPRMSLAEKENRLGKFHPSYKEGSLEELKIGPSKGYGVPPEICNKGDPENPLSWDEMVERFYDLTGGIMKKDQRLKIVEEVKRLARIKDLRKWSTLLIRKE